MKLVGLSDYGGHHLLLSQKVGLAGRGTPWASDRYVYLTVTRCARSHDVGAARGGEAPDGGGTDSGGVHFPKISSPAAEARAHKQAQKALWRARSLSHMLSHMWTVVDDGRAPYVRTHDLPYMECGVSGVGR